MPNLKALLTNVPSILILRDCHKQNFRVLLKVYPGFRVKFYPPQIIKKLLKSKENVFEEIENRTAVLFNIKFVSRRNTFPLRFSLKIPNENVV